MPLLGHLPDSFESGTAKRSSILNSPAIGAIALNPCNGASRAEYDEYSAILKIERSGTLMALCIIGPARPVACVVPNHVWKLGRLHAVTGRLTQPLMGSAAQEPDESPTGVGASLPAAYFFATSHGVTSVAPPR